MSPAEQFIVDQRLTELYCAIILGYIGIPLVLLTLAVVFISKTKDAVGFCAGLFVLCTLCYIVPNSYYERDKIKKDPQAYVNAKLGLNKGK